MATTADKVCPLCGFVYVDWALHIDEALGTCSETQRFPREEYRELHVACR